jgi:uncharacterized membrane protein (DUF485 family)
MSSKDFIFSNQRHYRITRHLLFFGILGIVFFLQSIVPGIDIYHTAFVSLCCFFPLCILSVYLCLYYFLPFFLKKKRYGRFVLAFTLMAGAVLAINYFMTGVFLRFATGFPQYNKARMGLSFINTSHALIIGGLALGIKFAKNLYLRQTENSVLARQKIITELHLEKARIYPRFLYQSLDNLRAGINSGSPDASSLLLKISDLLSYILYDNNEQWVLLEKELVMMQNLIDIEKSSRAKHLNIRAHISGNPADKYIVPMTLFPLLENCFNALDEKKINFSKINLDIKIRPGELYVNLGIADTLGHTNISGWRNIFQYTGQRLDALYPGGCRLKIKEEKQSLTVLLHVTLKNEAVNKSGNFVRETTESIYEN